MQSVKGVVLWIHPEASAYLDGGGSGSVPGAHVTVTLGHRSGGRQVTVFTVHVVST